jgi:DNA-directed RNA polymerase specialized sigma24 family protein
MQAVADRDPLEMASEAQEQYEKLSRSAESYRYVRDRHVVRAVRVAGFTEREVAERLRLSHSMVHKIVAAE